MILSNFKRLFDKEEYINSTDESRLSQAITWLRFPLALLVILIHINPQNRDIFTPLSSIGIQHLSLESIYSIIGRLGYYFANLAVPFFFFTSGYFFYYHLKKWDCNIYCKKNKKRVRTLFVPYLIWNLLAVFFMYLSKILGIIILHKSTDDFLIFLDEFKWSEIFWNYNTWNIDKSSILGYSTPMYGPVLLPLWFLRDLIVVSFIFSPVIYYGIKYMKYFFLLILGFACLSGICIFNINFIGFFFFSFGAYFSILNKNLLALKKYNAVLLFISIISLVLCVIFDGNVYSSLFLFLYRLAGIPTAIFITLWLLNKKLIYIHKELSKTSFFIYALHTMTLIKFSCISVSIILTEKLFMASKYTFGYILSYFLSPLVCATLCLILFVLLKIYSPRILKVLTGDRI